MNDRRPDEVVVVLDETQAPNVEFAVAQQYRLVRLEGQSISLLQSRVQRYRIGDRRSPDEVIAAMQGDPRISLAQPNFLYRQQKDKAGAKRAPAANNTLNMLQYAPEKMRLGPAHQLATGQATLVAVIDSGIETTHPELQGAIIRTFNAVGDQTGKADAHGTAIAGIIAARGQLTGIAPAAGLLAARAFFPERGQALTTTFILLRAIEWSHANKARVFNLSFAGPKDDLIHKILIAVHSRGTILIAAAGNAGPAAPAAYPAAYPQVLAVTAVNKTDHLYEKANQGDYIEISAPGVDILVPVPRAGYDVLSGTSFAAAHVSGLVALMLERNIGLTSEEIRAHLTSTAQDLGPKGHDTLFGAGHANALNAVRAAIIGGNGANEAAPSATGAEAKPKVSPVSETR